MGVVKMRRGNYQEAIENFNQAIELEKDFAEAYSDRYKLLQLQDYHQGVTDCTQAINFAPDNFEAYLNRGVALQTRGLSDYHCLSIIIECMRSPS
ncbi:tetratricopeptide repeat protein [Nostoc sp. UIC 10607]